MAYVDTEIASQPECWRRAVGLAPDSAGALPRVGERVALVGCGTSWFMGMSYAVLRERAGHGETDAFQASEFPAGRVYDRVVAITRSGTTTEVLELLERLRGRCPTVAIVGDPTSPAAQLATDAVPMPFADERSVVQTRFATSALALLRTHLGEDLAAAVADAEAAVGAALPLGTTGIEQVTFLGRGWTVGLAQEAALKCREAAAFWAEAYPAMDYRHGPISIAAPGRVVWTLGDVPPGLAGEIELTGATFVPGPSARPESDRARPQPLDPMAQLILAQRFAVALATGRGLNPDAPRHLTRSVVLP